MFIIVIVDDDVQFESHCSDLRALFCEEKTGRFLCHHLDRVGELIISMIMISWVVSLCLKCMVSFYHLQLSVKSQDHALNQILKFR